MISLVIWSSGRRIWERSEGREEEPLGVQAKDFGNGLPGLAHAYYIQGNQEEPGARG